jgi:hypothetical protein
MIALGLRLLTHLESFMLVLVPLVSRTTPDEIASNHSMFSCGFGLLGVGTIAGDISDIGGVFIPLILDPIKPIWF